MGSNPTSASKMKVCLVKRGKCKHIGYILPCPNCGVEVILSPFGKCSMCGNLLIVPQEVINNYEKRAWEVLDSGVP